MNTIRPVLAHLRALLPASLLALGAVAQVPDGHYIVAAAASPTVPGSAGLFSVHPRTPGVVIPVTNLPPALTGGWQSGNGWSGPNCVLYRTDGSLLVGDMQPAGQPCSIHVLQLTGSAVTATTSVPVGTANGPFPHGGVQQMALLPNGDVLFCVWGLQNTAPLNGASLGILSLAGPTPVVTPVPWTPPTGTIVNAVAVAATGLGTFAYAGAGNPSPPWTSSIHEIDLRTNTGTTIANLPEATMSLTAFGNRVLAGATDAAGISNRLYSIEWRFGPGMTRTWSTRMLAATPYLPNGLAREAATGGIALATSTSNTGNGQNNVYWATSLGVPTLLATSVQGGWGVLTGIDVNPDPESYGAGGGLYLSAIGGPAGLPVQGNSWFSVTAGLGCFGAPSPPPTLGNPVFLVSGFARQDPPLPIPGTSLVLLVSPVAIQAVPTTGAPCGSVGVPFPIPNTPSLAGLPVRMQAFHVDNGGLLDSSNGLEFTVL